MNERVAQHFNRVHLDLTLTIFELQQKCITTVVTNARTYTITVPSTSGMGGTCVSSFPGGRDTRDIAHRASGPAPTTGRTSSRPTVATTLGEQV